MKIDDSQFLLQESIKRMTSYLETRARSKGRDVAAKPPSTQRIFLFYVKLYCEKIAERAPDELIRDRNQDLKSDSLAVKLRHEEMANRFITFLSKHAKSSNTIATALSAVRTFYATNYVDLSEKAVIVPTGRAMKAVWLPDPLELGKLLTKANARIAAYVCCAKDTGIGVGDLLDVQWETKSEEFGSIAHQLEDKKNPNPIHIHFKRLKTGIEFDTFLGDDAKQALRRYRLFGRALTMFPISSNQIRLDLKALDERLRPHTFRKYFTTYLKMALSTVLTKRGMFDSAGVSDAWVEYWTGHSLGKVRGAYNIPPVKLQMEVYREAYPRIKLRLK